MRIRKICTVALMIFALLLFFVILPFKHKVNIQYERSQQERQESIHQQKRMQEEFDKRLQENQKRIQQGREQQAKMQEEFEQRHKQAQNEVEEGRKRVQ